MSRRLSSLVLLLSACGGAPPDAPVEGSGPEGLFRACWFWRDADGDGYGGTSRVRTPGCLQPPGYVRNPLDCDDASASAHPGATETCNDVDDDCDGVVDLYAVDEQVWYRDADGDGVGRWAVTQLECDQPPGYAATFGDCADTNPARFPGAAETCNGADDDCDGQADDNDPDTVGQSWWYQDADADGFGDALTAVYACEWAGASPTDDDCDDGSADVSPGAAEVCGDGIDQDCDGLDEPCTPCSGEVLFAEDFDSSPAGTDLTDPQLGWTRVSFDPPNVRSWVVSAELVDEGNSARADSSAPCCGYSVYTWTLPAYELANGDRLELRGALQVSDTFGATDSESASLQLYQDFLGPAQRYLGVSLSGVNARLAWSDVTTGASDQQTQAWTSATVEFRLTWDGQGLLEAQWRPAGTATWIAFAPMTPTSPFLPTVLALQAERTGWNADTLAVRVIRADDLDDDGICDAEDVCPGFDDRTDTDGNGVPDGC